MIDCLPKMHLEKGLQAKFLPFVCKNTVRKFFVNNGIPLESLKKFVRYVAVDGLGQGRLWSWRPYNMLLVARNCCKLKEFHISTYIVKFDLKKKNCTLHLC